MVRRSALALKLLTYAPTGAIVAAPTTSLPEAPGGERNWDYRYCWLRDAGFTLYALAVLGYSGEAGAFSRFLKLVCSKRPERIQIMYGIGAEMALDEKCLEHLEGYCGSRPVRIGNDALDRGLSLLGEQPEWRALRERLREDILRRGVDPVHGHLLQAYDHAGTDAALLLAPMLGLPLEAGTLERTVAAIERELRKGDYVERYRTPDGLEGEEGAFLICSFWLVDAYLALGRQAEARALFERLCRRANDVGLFSEEIDPASHAFLGNFPQAFTHLALIGNAAHRRRDVRLAGAVGSLQGLRARRPVLVVAPLHPVSSTALFLPVGPALTWQRTHDWLHR